MGALVSDVQNVHQTPLKKITMTLNDVSSSQNKK